MTLSISVVDVAFFFQLKRAVWKGVMGHKGLRRSESELSLANMTISRVKRKKIGLETNSPVPSPTGKRTRERKMKLMSIISIAINVTTMMVLSLNGLGVAYPIPETIMDSPARSESMFYLRLSPR